MTFELWPLGHPHSTDPILIYLLMAYARLCSVGVCTELSATEPHKQVGVVSMLTSGSIGGIIVRTLVWNGHEMWV